MRKIGQKEYPAWSKVRYVFFPSTGASCSVKEKELVITDEYKFFVCPIYAQ